MKEKKNRIIRAGIVLASMCLLLFVGGRENHGQEAEEVPDAQQKEEQEPAWKQYADEPVTFDWYVNFSWFHADWGENVVSRKITEDTGVSIDFMAPNGNESNKLKSMITADTLPDFITLGWWDTQLHEMIDKDMVYALNELADTYDAYFWKVSNPEVVDWYTQTDGNIYGYPNYSVSPKNVEEHKEIGSNQSFLVRKDIYEAIGSPDMTTPEGFREAVQKAYEMFPEVDGRPLIPVGAEAFTDEGNLSFDGILMNFLAIPFEKDGKIYDRYSSEDYVNWLKMFRQLREDGLLADDIFVDQRLQIEEKMVEGRYFCMLYQNSDITSQQKEIYASHPERVYMAVDGPRNASGDDPTLTTTGINGWTMTLISKNCEHPERAIAFMDYLLSDQGQRCIYLGVEGETYDLVDGEPVVRDAVNELLNSDRQEYDRLYGADDMYWMLQDGVKELQWQQKTIEPLEQVREWTYPYVVYNGQYDSFLELGSEAERDNAAITKLWRETLPQLLMAESDKQFDQLYQEFLDQREDCGFERVQREKNRLMKVAKERLGIE